MLTSILEVSAQHSYKHYTSSDGLQHDVTYNIIQDSKGHIWIATDDGLSKFDGQDFRNYTLKEGLTSNYVMDIEEISANKYALATWGGGLHFLENDSIYKNLNFKDENVKSYDIKYFNNKIFTNSGSELLVYDLKRNIFNSKIYMLSENDFIDELKPDVLYQKLEHIILNDKVYVHNQEPSKSNFKGVKLFVENFELQNSFPFLSELEISTAIELESSTYVFAVNNELLFSNEKRIMNKVKVDVIGSNESIVKILNVPNAKNNYLLLVRNEKGEKRLFDFNIKTKVTIAIDKKISINTPVSDAMFDFENNLWISTYGNGIYCYYYSNPKITNLLEGQYITDIIKNDDTIYAQTSSQLYKFNENSIISKNAINGFAKHLSINNNKITVSALSAKTKSLPEFNIVDGRFYGETLNSRVRQSDTIFINNNAVLISNELFVKFIKEGDGVLDLYTNKGKWIYNLKDKNLSKDLLFEIGLPSEKINDLIIGDNVYYIATDKGLVIKKDNVVTVYNNETGLQNERINSVLLKDDNLYLGTQSGMSVIKEGKVYNFSKSFGILSLSINKIIEQDNKLWLAGNNGISIVNIEDIIISNSPKLNISQNKNVFTYKAISYLDQNGINLQYKINDNNWIRTSSSKGNLDFSNYTANDYKIEFRAQNSQSDWAHSSIFNFEIKPPWYKVWWIILLCFLSVAAAITIVFFQRLKVVSRRNKALKNEIARRIIAESELSDVRDNIAQDFHDDLGNKLASISLLSDVLSKKVENEESKVVKTIKEDADYLYKGTKDFIFSLQEQSNYVEEIIVYLSDFAEDYLFQFGIDFEVQSNVKSNIKLPYYWSKQIIYIFKEAITNSAKHANAENAKMLFSFDTKELIIEFTDDGKGFDINSVRLNGISNMEARADRIDCSVKVETKIDKGTSIIFKGKLPQ